MILINIDILDRIPLGYGLKMRTSLLNHEHDSIANCSEIKQLLLELQDLEFGNILSLCSKLADCLYKNLQNTGLYEGKHGNNFICIQKREKNQANHIWEEEIVIGSKLDLQLQEIRALFNSLKKQKYCIRGAVVLNTISIILGIKILEDRKITHTPNRRQLLINALMINKMPVGLYDISGKDLAVEKIYPQLFFDILELDKSILKLRFNHKIKVDTLVFNSLVSKLKMIKKLNQNDTYLQEWCNLKLIELDKFASGLRHKTKSDKYVLTHKLHRIKIK